MSILQFVNMLKLFIYVTIPYQTPDKNIINLYFLYNSVIFYRKQKIVLHR